MTDQADRLRRMTRDANASVAHNDWGTPTLVVGSGKGGVGKSVISVLLATEFARAGSKVLLMDGDLNLGNLHILLGVQPVARVETLLHGDVTPEELVVRMSDNLFVLPTDSGGEILHTLGTVDRARLYHRLISVSDQFDVVIVDAGAGIESMVRCTAASSCRPIVVTVPEPAALADAYAVIKILNLQVPGVGVSVLVNRVTGDAQGQVAFDRLNTASERFLQTPLTYVGALAEDAKLQSAVRKALPFWNEPDGAMSGVHPLVAQMRSMFELEPALSSAGA